MQCSFAHKKMKFGKFEFFFFGSVLIVRIKRDPPAFLFDMFLSDYFTADVNSLFNKNKLVKVYIRPQKWNENTHGQWRLAGNPNKPEPPVDSCRWSHTCIKNLLLFSLLLFNGWEFQRKSSHACVWTQIGAINSKGWILSTSSVEDIFWKKIKCFSTENFSIFPLISCPERVCLA